jgi:hypothetical protein
MSDYADFWFQIVRRDTGHLTRNRAWLERWKGIVVHLRGMPRILKNKLKEII